MNTKTTMSITEARKKIFDLAEAVQTPNTHYTLTEKGRPKAVLMSAEEYESWAETLEVIHDFPDLDKDIKEAELALKSGAYKKWTTLESLLTQHSLMVADQAKKPYGVSANSKTKSRKKSS